MSRRKRKKGRFKNKKIILSKGLTKILSNPDFFKIDPPLWEKWLYSFLTNGFKLDPKTKEEILSKHIRNNHQNDN